MKESSWIQLGSVALLLCSAVSTLAQDSGLRVDTSSSASRIQGRIGLGNQTSNWSGKAGIVLGDYYFDRTRLGTGEVSSGFRATSGLLLGQRVSVLGSPGTVQNSINDVWSAMPYVGIGWTSLSVRKGWGLTADLGLVARTSSGGLRLGNAQTLDDLLRELRLNPLIQVGVSYAF